MSPRHVRILLLAMVACAAMFAMVLAARPAEGQDCRTLDGAVVINLDDIRSPAAVDHVRGAVRAGQPWLLHVDRKHEDLHRRASLRGVPTRAGFDRDEYPPAVSAEGGAGADVKLIPSSDNRIAGSKMGHVLGVYCDGQAFVFQP